MSPQYCIYCGRRGVAQNAPQRFGGRHVSEHRPGYYQDANGEWHKDRRQSNERRLPRGDANWPHHDRRLQLRRKTDLEFVERDAREQIQDALDDFASHHDPHGHLIDD